MVPRVLSFVYDHLASVRLTGRCLNGVGQGVVGFVRYGGRRAAAPRYRCRSAAERYALPSGAFMPLRGIQRAVSKFRGLKHAP